MAGKANDGLSDEWRAILQENFVSFRDHLRPNGIIPILFSKFVINSTQKQDLDAIPTEYAKTEYLFNEVLRRTSRGNLAIFKSALRSTSQTHLIPYLPPELPYSYAECDVTAAATKEGESANRQPIVQTTDDSMETDEPGTVLPPPPPPTAPVAPVQQPYQTPPQSFSMPTTHAQQPADDHQWPKYRRQPYGTAICVVFGFFVESVKNNDRDPAMPGFYADMKNIHQKFKDMNYDVTVHTNLNEKEFREKMSALQRRVNSEQVDRLVVIVLSHGNENGFSTCKHGSGHQDEGTCIRFNEVVNYFTPEEHKAPGLKGCPKYFIFNCCRGQKMIDTAGLGDSGAMAGEPHQLPVHADLLISYATVDEHKAVVHKEEGSWFFKAFLEALEKLHPKVYNIYQILTYVNYAVASYQHDDIEKGDRVRYKQMPTFQSTLRYNFYLQE